MFGKFAFYIKDFDWFIFLLALSIAVVGVVEIHSATQYNRGDRFFIKQIYWIILGLILMLTVMSIDYHTLVENVPYFYVIAVVSLIGVLILGHRVSGSKSWISVGGTSAGQPSEFVKIAVVLALARFLCEIRTEYLTAIDILKGSCIVGLPVLLVLLQPDLGSALTFIPVALVGLFLGGLRPKWIVLFAILSVLVPILGWYNLKVYQKERIYTFLEPERDPLGAGYHSIQSKIAVGSGGLGERELVKEVRPDWDFFPNATQISFSRSLGKSWDLLAR